jgi:uncharacterized protein YqiB (DUF1249 family)
MSLQNQPKKHSPETLSAFQAAYEAAYSDLHRLYARMSRTEEATRELEITLSQALAALVTDGVTDPRELRRRAFEAVALTFR